MKKKSIITLIIGLTLVMVMFLTSCGNKAPQTMEDYVSSNEEVQQQIQDAADASGLAVEIKGNDVIYTYDLSTFEGMNEELAKSDTMKSNLESALDAASPTFENLCSQLEEESEIQGVQIIVNYTFGDEVVVTKSFTAAASEESEG